jgi:hypothetical protein
MTYGELPERIVWVDDATVVLSGGPARVVTDEPDPDFVAPPLLGFTRPTGEREPLLWDGDQA